MKNSPLPASWQECRQRGWQELDILLVTGDAYVDHPSFGVALIGRHLEAHGYRVAILAQPRYDSAADFLVFPPPRLFCGITAGNLDSIVANYSGNGKVRDTDAYSPGGNPWRSAIKERTNRYRPDHASLVYSNLARSAFRGVPIILGGIEASLRRFVHYDFKQEKLRGSILTDAKADLLVYGMGEKAVLELARRCEAKRLLSELPGTCERLTDKEMSERHPDAAGSSSKYLLLPAFSAIAAKPELFMEAEISIDRHGRAGSQKISVQRQQNHWVVLHPAMPCLSGGELDALYDVPFSRQPHPATPDIPAFRMIRNSVTIVRGCSGNCSFCAITRHQGAEVQSRSNRSIVRECRHIAAADGFDGTISDLGGPTANLFATSCAIGGCPRRDCLYPKICKHLQIDEQRFIDLLKEVKTLPAIRHLFISSGLRMELLLRTPRLLEALVLEHIPGAMKIAQEHTCNDVLALMHKEPHTLLKEFIRQCRTLEKRLGKALHFVPYIISSHPGSTQRHAERLARDTQNLGLTITKFQDFTATPGTLSTAMYVTGRDPGGNTLYVARNNSERKKQRVAIERRFHRRPGKKRRG